MRLFVAGLLLVAGAFAVATTATAVAKPLTPSSPDPPSSTRKKDRPDAKKMRALEEAVMGARVMSVNSFSAKISSSAVASDDVSPAQILISSAKAKALSLATGDLVSVRGKKRKYSLAEICVGPVKADFAQLSSEVSRNIRIREGDVVVMNSVGEDIKTASKITCAPFSEDMAVGEMSAEDLAEGFVKKYFTKNKFAHIDDVFSVSCDSRVISFKVTGIEAAEDGIKTSKTQNGGSVAVGEVEHSAVLVGEGTAFFCDLEDMPSRTRDPTLNDVGYDDIGGCRSQLASIRELIELPLRHPALFQKVGVPPPRGVLLHGPSGTGKTSLCRAVAAETGAFFFVVNGPEVMSKGSGESEKNLRLAFEEAEKNSPAIIFIDEIDCIAPKRDKAGGEVEKRIVSQLMTLMDGIKPTSQVVVIAATNRPNVMEPALRRFGRFDKEILISQPSEEGRLEILQIKTRDMKISKSVNLADVARETHGYVLCVTSRLSDYILRPPPKIKTPNLFDPFTQHHQDTLAPIYHRLLWKPPLLRFARSCPTST